jgi:transcriptional regulator with XRE-family HTH domain
MKRSIGVALKSSAKSKGYTQSQIAKRMGVSLPTVKRWFVGQGLDLSRLEVLLKLLGLSLGELSDLVSSKESSESEFSLEQEAAFARDPMLLAFFEQLVSKKSLKKSCSDLRILEDKGNRYLRKLEGLGLLERHPHNQIKFHFYGQVRWRIDGPLARRLKKMAIDTFLSQNLFKSVRLGTHKINLEDLVRLEAMLVDLQAFTRSAENRASHYPDRPTSIGLLVGCANFSWSIASAAVAEK